MAPKNLTTPALTTERLSASERWEAGKALRQVVPRSAHSEWYPTRERPDPIALLEASALGRIPELIPIRYGRMLQSPFAFLRGAAMIMAADLATTPTTGIQVQACGDCHLLNFGGFASPERHLIFCESPSILQLQPLRDTPSNRPTPNVIPAAAKPKST